MSEKYYILNPTQHTLQIYDIVRILSGSEDEPSVTECVITNKADLEAIKGTESWGLKVLSQTEYDEIVSSLEEEEEEEVPVFEIEKVRVSNQRRKRNAKPVQVEEEEEFTEVTE